MHSYYPASAACTCSRRRTRSRSRAPSPRRSHCSIELRRMIPYPTPV